MEAEILDAAAALLERDGWLQTQERVFDRDGKVIGRCAVGAIHDATATLKAENIADWEDIHAAMLNAKARVANYINLPGAPQRTVVGWNDMPGQTQDRVCKALRVTALLARD